MNIKEKIKKNFKLAPLTTFKIGGEAEFYLEANTRQDVEEAFSWAREMDKPLTIFGGGSNVLINDEGIKGLVLRLSNSDIKIEEARVECGASFTLTKLARETSAHGLSGLEWSAGIPGAQLGGAIFGNAGAFGVTMSDIIEKVEVFDLEEGNWKSFSKDDCGFDYRSSIFKKNKKYLIFRASLSMEEKKMEEVSEKMEEILKIRGEKQPKYPNAGSIFKNVGFEYLKERNPELAKRAESEGILVGGMVPSGWLIEKRDLKGKEIGGALISPDHSNFIINKNKATALDVITLISYIKQKIRNEFNVQLQEEVQYLGF